MDRQKDHPKANVNSLDKSLEKLPFQPLSTGTWRLDTSCLYWQNATIQKPHKQLLEIINYRNCLVSANTEIQLLEATYEISYFMNLIRKLMMKFTLFIAMLFLSVTANSQQELRNVFREIDSLDFTRAKFYLVDSIEYRTEKKITNDNAIYFAASVDNFSSVWTNKLFDSAIIISRKYIDSVAKESIFDVPKHFSFSLPYFSKDKQSFLIYYSYWCGSLCAEHSLRLYKRVGKKWKFAKYILIEVS